MKQTINLPILSVKTWGITPKQVRDIFIRRATERMIVELQRDREYTLIYYVNYNQYNVCHYSKPQMNFEQHPIMFSQ